MAVPPVPTNESAAWHESKETPALGTEHNTKHLAFSDYAEETPWVVEYYKKQKQLDQVATELIIVTAITSVCTEHLQRQAGKRKGAFEMSLSLSLYEH